MPSRGMYKKLDPKERSKIQRLYSEGLSKALLARRFHVCEQTIRDITNGTTNGTPKTPAHA